MAIMSDHRSTDVTIVKRLNKAMAIANDLIGNVSLPAMVVQTSLQL